MSERNSKAISFKRAPLAAAVALALSAPVAFAAAPSATQLPGNGYVVSGSVTGPQNVPTSGPETIKVNGTAVISWGDTSKTATINTKQPGGFNIGSSATLNFSGTGSTNAVLNIDASGNPSQIMGTLNGSTSDIFVANGNGIIVGSGATINNSGSAVGLIGESGSSLSTTNFAAAGTMYDGIEFNGTAGGDVSVGKASVNGSTILVAGGSNVNVNLDSLHATAATFPAVTVMAGEPSPSSGSFTSSNKSAVLTVNGTAPAYSSIDTAGNLVTTGTTDFAQNNGTLGLSVGGTLTNQGTLNIQDPNNDGLNFAIVNNGKVDLTLTSGADNGSASLNNAPSSLTVSNYDWAVFHNDVTNNGQIQVNNQDTTNNYPSAVWLDGGSLTNNGTINTKDSSGNSTQPLALAATNGSITNSGTMSNIARLETASDPSLASFTAGADYSITNSGSVSGLASPLPRGDATIMANTDRGTGTNDSTGSFTNTGILAFSKASVGAGTSPNPANLAIAANNDLSLGGQVEQYATGTASSASAVSATNPLGAIVLDGENGTVTLSTPLAFVGPSTTPSLTDSPSAPTAEPLGVAGLMGQQVKVMANLSGVASASDSTPAGFAAILAGDKPTSGYAVRVAAGKTVSAYTVDVYGQNPSSGSYDHPNVILQGMLSGNTINLGGTDSSNGAVSDVFTGPAGGLAVSQVTPSSGNQTPSVTMNFTGAVKNAKYTNSSNFRYNYLPITSDAPMDLTLNPIAYQTNGTTGVSSSGSPSAVNILVNNDVTVTSFAQPSSVPDATGSAVTGVNTWPNTHLVLQTTGNVDLATTPAANGTSPASFYWPGLVYLGTIDTANGQPAPGTVNPLGQITTDGVFNNVLPGNTDAGGGIHFMTALPLQLGGDVVTNANSWVNFATDTLTSHYASTNPTATNQFFGGVLGTGNVVNYSLLPSAYFHTQVPVSTQ